MKRNILLFIIVFSFGSFASEKIVKKIIAHIPDQFNNKHNDPKWLSGGGTVGQSFTPKVDRISLFSAAIAAGAKKNGNIKLERISEKNNLGLAIRELKNIKTESPESGQGIIYKDPFKIGQKDFFEINENLIAGEQYYFEFKLLSPSGDNYFYRYQYGGDLYPNGDIYKNGKKWANSDFDFTTYCPFEIAEKPLIDKMLPIIFEIVLNKNIDKSKADIFILGPTGVLKVKKNWKNDTTVFLDPIKLDTYSKPEIEYKLCVKYFDENENAHKIDAVPFTLLTDKD